MSLKPDPEPYSFKCDLHGWMTGRVRVFDHPYFTTTDADGKFEFKDAPVGTWRISYWHEVGFHKGKEGAFGIPIEVKADKKIMELAALKFVLPPPSVTK